MPDVSPPSLPGAIYTFYSYKGGVGRSMAVANIGVLLALAGKRVLLVDWDLEAPGLERFFEEAARLRGDSRSVPGILDLLESRSRGGSLSWRDCLLQAEFLGTSLDIISAGSRTSDYRNRIQQLNWEVLYRDYNVGEFIDGLRGEWRSRDNYDFILVDSRTGITDIGDICTVLLPDAIVLMFVTNHQNVDGIKDMMTRAIRVRNSLPIQRNKLLGIPLPARDEVYNEYDKALAWKKVYAEQFADLYREWLPKEVSPVDALHKLFIPYVTNWSFGERLPVLENARETQDPTTIGASYKRVANLLSSGLDWYSLEGADALETLQGTQVELMREREHAVFQQEQQLKLMRVLEEAQLRLQHDREQAAARLADQDARLDEQAKAHERERLEILAEQHRQYAQVTHRYSLVITVLVFLMFSSLAVWLWSRSSPDPVASLVKMGWTVQTGSHGAILRFIGDPPYKQSAALLAQLRVTTVSIANVSQISGIESWSGSQTLSSLELSGPVSDLTPLSSLKRLSALRLAGTNATDIRPLGPLESLSALDLSNTRVTDLSPLGNLRNLSELNISDTPVTDLGPLSKLRNLLALNLSQHSFSFQLSFDGFGSRSAPSASDVRFPDIGYLNLEPLEGLDALRQLDISGREIRDLSPLLRMHGLSILKISEPGGSKTVRISNPTIDLLRKKEIELIVDFEFSPNAG